MKRSDLERALREAKRVARETDFYLIGSQAMHAYSSDPPPEVLLSQECDLYPRSRIEAVNLLDTELGRNSAFAHKHGFHVDVVTPELASLPNGWESRLKPLRAGSVTAWCLEIHDLVVSKLAAGRLKDSEFVIAVLRSGAADPGVIKKRILEFPMEGERERMRSRLTGLIQEVGRTDSAL